MGVQHRGHVADEWDAVAHRAPSLPQLPLGHSSLVRCGVRVAARVRTPLTAGRVTDADDAMGDKGAVVRGAAFGDRGVD